MSGTHTIQNYKADTKADYYVKVGNKSSASTSDFRRGGGASVPTTVERKNFVAPTPSQKATPYAPGAAAPPKVASQPIRQHPVNDGSRTSSQPIRLASQPIRNPASSTMGGGGAAMTMAQAQYSAADPMRFQPPSAQAQMIKDKKEAREAKLASIDVQADRREARLQALQQQKQEREEQTQQASFASAGSGSSGAGEGGVVTVPHDGQKGTKKDTDTGVRSGGVFEAGSKGGRKNDFGGSTAVAVGPNGSAGLTDIQKVRKYGFQIEQAQGKLAKLGDQEAQIQQQMAGATDPAQQQQLAMQLGSVQQQQQKASARLQNKQQKLDKVQNRMASAGVDPAGQGVKAVAIAGVGNQGGKNRDLKNVGGADDGRPQGASFGGSYTPGNASGGGNALAGVGGPDAGRPNGNGNGQGGGNRGNGVGNGGGNGTGNEGLGGGRPQAVAVGAQNNGVPGNGGGGNFTFGGAQDGRPQAVGLGNGNGGGKKDDDGPKNGGNGGGGQFQVGGAQDGRPHAVAFGSNGDGGGKKDNDGPKAMGGPVGGGKNDSLPTNPPKLATLGGGGGGFGGGKGGNKKN